ncbi:MAG: phosphatase PAP2 family protein [Acidobacteriaceae bacterium]
MPIRPSFLVAGLILFAFAASCAQAQALILPLNPNPNVESTQSASLVDSTFDSDENTARNPTTPDTSTLNTGPSQPSASTQDDKPICGITRLGRCIEDLGEDEKGILTSPLRLQPKDAYWLAPLGAATGLALAYDADAAQAAGVDVNRANIANKIADFGSFWATDAEGAGIYFIGLAQKNPKLAETGRLSAEAIIDSGTVTLATKLVTNRQRPNQGNGRGDFWPFGTEHWEWDSSFPSDHATATMALARVISGEYPHWYVMVPAYGFVEMVSISRILANQHFPSDILVGQAIGFLIGSYVLNHRALYRPGAKKTLAAKLIGSVNPIADPRTRTLGASMEIPFGQHHPL